MNLYLAGPMRGYPEFNFAAFVKAAPLLRAAGHTVFSPAERDLGGGFDPTGTTGSTQDLAELKFDLRAALGADLAWICGTAHGVVVLPGWQASRGAQAEVATACALGLPVWEFGPFALYDTEAERVGP